RRGARVLPGTLPCGARTFLRRRTTEAVPPAILTRALGTCYPDLRRGVLPARLLQLPDLSARDRRGSDHDRHARLRLGHRRRRADLLRRDRRLLEQLLDRPPDRTQQLGVALAPREPLLHR